MPNAKLIGAGPLPALLLALVAAAAGSAGWPVNPGERPAPMVAAPARANMVALARAGTRLVAAGERGLVVVSDDGGASWRQARVPVGVTLTALRFATAREGWAVGHAGVILHTADGGLHWRRQDDAAATGSGAPDDALFDFCHLDDGSLLAAGAYGLLLRSVDGGRHWQRWAPGPLRGESRHIYGIAAAGRSLYLAGEAGLFYRSHDEGHSFEAVPMPYAGSYFGVLATASGGVLVYGLEGNAFRSDDEGTHWRRLAIGGPAGLTAAVALQDGTLLFGSAAGELLRMAPGGVRASRLPQPPAGPLAALATAADGAIVAAGARGVVRLPAWSAR